MTHSRHLTYGLAVPALVCATLAVGAPGYAAGDKAAGDKASATQSSQNAMNSGRTISAATPRNAEDQDWLVVTGTVGKISDGAFTLDYDGGSIVVEMDSFANGGEVESLSEGDRVTVSGFADTLFFGSHTIEAASVYDFNDSKVIRASAVDEEGDAVQYPFVVDPLDVGNRLTLTGTVQAVNGQRMLVTTNDRPVTINLSTLKSEEKSVDTAKLEQGDRVRIDGILDNSVFSGMEINAGTVSMLDGNGQSGSNAGKGG